jgi:CelD/BcsL family acetyltransferase involved in cellulose biosynthesis
MFTLEVVTEPSKFYALKESWNALANKLANPFLRFEWFEAALKAYTENATLTIFVISAGGELKGIAPFVVQNSEVVGRRRILGYQTGEPNGLLYADEKSLVALCEYILKDKRPLVIMRLNAESAELQALKHGPRAGGLLIVREKNTLTARVHLQADWAKFQGKMPKKSRTTIQQKRRAAEREGALALEAISPGEVDVDGHLQELFRVEASGWKRDQGTAMSVHSPTRQFFTEYARKAACLGFLRMFFLRLNSVNIAALLAVQRGDKLWCLKQGYDERWSKYAPGILLTHEVLRYASTSGLSACELLGSAETWQKRWPIEVDEYTTVRFYPRSVNGAALFAEDAIASTFRRLAGTASVRRSNFISPLDKS